MMKKFGVVTVGVTAGLLAAAPLASAGEHHEGHDESGSGSASVSSQDCNATGGGAGAVSEIAGDSLANAVSQSPVGGSVAGNIICSDVLSGNGNGNTLALTL